MLNIVGWNHKQGRIWLAFFDFRDLAGFAEGNRARLILNDKIHAHYLAVKFGGLPKLREHLTSRQATPHESYS